MGNNKEYWEDNLLKWERRRYSKLAAFNIFSHPLKARMNCCLNKILELKDSLTTKRLVIKEFGCGSGVLAQKIAESGIPCQYTGYDISKEGIEKAKSRDLSTDFNFQVSDLTQAPKIGATDIAIFLGLSDWFSLDQNRFLLRSIPSQFYLWSYTLKDTKKIENNSYSFFRQARNRNKLSTLSFTKDEIDKLFIDCKLKRFNPDQKFSFGPGYISCLVSQDNH